MGLHGYRGANAGDFAGINVIDLLLGLCEADDPYYSQLLVDKFLFMRPDDQLVLRDAMRRKSLLNSFVEALQQGLTKEPWFELNLRLFLQVCEAHGQTARQHHEQLVSKFIENRYNAYFYGNKVLSDLPAKPKIAITPKKDPENPMKLLYDSGPDAKLARNHKNINKPTDAITPVMRCKIDITEVICGL